MDFVLYWAGWPMLRTRVVMKREKRATTDGQTDEAAGVTNYFKLDDASPADV
jgi:hypothetical protein